MAGIYDQQRKAINLAVLHHSVTREDMSWQELSNIGRNRTYKDYSHSYHYKDGIENFIAYHFLIYRDGRVVRTLQDNEIGWHCGNWEKNTRSIGICFIGDYRKYDPNLKQLRACADIIRPFDNKVGGKLNVLGHCEIVSTECPARVLNFRDRIVDYINNSLQGDNMSDCENKLKEANVRADSLHNDIVATPSSGSPKKKGWGYRVNELDKKNIKLDNKVKKLSQDLDNCKKQKVDETEKLLKQIRGMEVEAKELQQEWLKSEKEMKKRVLSAENDLHVEKQASIELNKEYTKSGELIEELDEKIRELEADIVGEEVWKKDLKICEELCLKGLDEKGDLMHELIIKTDRIANLEKKLKQKQPSLIDRIINYLRGWRK